MGSISREFKRDVLTAFLNSKVDKPIYVSRPEGLEGLSDGEVLELLRALYGLKQAPRLWQKEFERALK